MVSVILLVFISFTFLDDEKLSESSKEEKAALVKTCKHIFADKYGKDWNKSVL